MNTTEFEATLIPGLKTSSHHKPCRLSLRAVNHPLVTSEVPQGSFLGPLLYLVYINGLPSKCKFIACLLVDHCLLFVHREMHISSKKTLTTFNPCNVTSRSPSIPIMCGFQSIQMRCHSHLQEEAPNPASIEPINNRPTMQSIWE